MKRRKQPPVMGLDAALEVAAPSPSAQEILEAQEARHRVQAAVQALPEAERAAVLLYYMGDHSHAAIAEFQRVAELAPTLAAAHVNLGAAYYGKRDFTRAVPPLRKALELNPDLPGARQMLGAALLAQGASAEAIPYLEKVQADDLLGIALLDAGRAREAVDRLEAALLKRPDDADLLYYLAQAHTQLSERTFERLRAHPASQARTQQMLGEVMAAAGNRPAAEKHFQAALAARPDLRGVHLALGQFHLTAGDYAKAETEFRAEKALTPASAAVAYRLGSTLANRGKMPEAVEELKRAHQLAPDMPETSLELGKALAATGELKEAEVALRQVFTAESASSLAEAAHLQLAQIYRKQGRAADAGRELKSLQELRARRRVIDSRP